VSARRLLATAAGRALVVAFLRAAPARLHVLRAHFASAARINRAVWLRRDPPAAMALRTAACDTPRWRA
jgi:hypothetical protein